MHLLTRGSTFSSPENVVWARLTGAKPRPARRIIATVYEKKGNRGKGVILALLRVVKLVWVALDWVELL